MTGRYASSGSWIKTLRKHRHTEKSRKVPTRRFITGTVSSLEVLEGRALPSTLVVWNTLDNGPGSLRGAIAAAASGDGIVFDGSLQGQTITLTTGELALTKSLDIHGPLGNPVVISGNYASSVFDVTDSSALVSLFGLTITHGYANGGGSFNDGGGIYNAGTMIVSRCSVDDNFGVGSGIYNAGTMIVSRCSLDGNFGDGGIYNAGTMTVSQCSLDDNGGFDAGAIHNTGTMTVSRSSLSANVSWNGGGIRNDGALDISQSTLTGNTSNWLGGGISNTFGGSLTVSACTFSGNLALPGLLPCAGGGIVNLGTATVDHSTFTGNTAGRIVAHFLTLGGGGGIANFGTLSVNACDVSGNVAAYGGGIMNLDNLNFIGIPFRRVGRLTVSDSVLSDNFAGGIGGGLFNDAMATVTESVLCGNSTDGPSGSGGGGIVNGGTLALIDSTLFDNSAVDGIGGGILNYGSATLSDCTLFANSAMAGGGIYNGSLGSLTVLKKSSVFGNAATSGADLYNLGSYTLDTSSIIGVIGP